MRISRWDEQDLETLQGILEVEQATLAADDPQGPPVSEHRLRAILLGRANMATEAWYAAEDGAIEGWCRLRMPRQENLHIAFLAMSVHPRWRRQGLGTELLRHAAARARAHGRSVLAGETFAGTAGARFAVAAGATAGLTEARRFLHVPAIEQDQIAGLRRAAEKEAAGYSLMRWMGPVPDAHLDGVAAVIEAMNDAPSDHEAARWDGQRVRDHFNAEIEHSGCRCYTIVAVHDVTGQAAGMTEVEVDPASPEWGFQEITAVARPHRGHRLGLLLKTAMLEWLAAAEPGLETIETGNAAVNQHMISINEQLGFEAVRPWWQSYDLPVEAVLGRPSS